MAKAGRIRMSIDLHRLIAWFSPAFPIGAFSYSHGLEAAIEFGDVTNGAGLRDWLYSVLTCGSGRNDAILLAHSYSCSEAQSRKELSELALALSAGFERRIESEKQGIAFAKTASAVSTHEFPSAPLPIIVGHVAAYYEIDVQDVVSVYLHAFVSNLVSAAIRLMPIGQIEGQKILHSLFETIEAVTDEAINASLDDLGSSCFLADLSSMAHETQQPRIFRT